MVLFQTESVDLQGRVDDRDTANHLCRLLVDISWKYMVKAEGWVGVKRQKQLSNPSELEIHDCGTSITILICCL